MGSAKEEKNDKMLTPNMAGYRLDRGWRPDLTAYRKAMLLHHVSFQEVDTLLKKYAALYSGEKQLACDFFYTSLPGDTAWLYLEFPNFENCPHSLNFWHYQNLLIWLSQKSDKEFCLAIPKNQNSPLFLSTVDRKNPYGDSCVGIYADRDFYFEVPGDVFEWGPVPNAAFNFMGFLKGAFQFDTRWIPKTVQCKWERTQITIALSE